MAHGRWYVTTRERVDVGPYDSKEEAEVAADHLGKALDGIDEPAVAIALISEFVRRRHALPNRKPANSAKHDRRVDLAVHAAPFTR